jgi:hypothetical protein
VFRCRYRVGRSLAKSRSKISNVYALAVGTEHVLSSPDQRTAERCPGTSLTVETVRGLPFALGRRRRRLADGDSDKQAQRPALERQLPPRTSSARQAARSPRAIADSKYFGPRLPSSYFISFHCRVVPPRSLTRFTTPLSPGPEQISIILRLGA